MKDTKWTYSKIKDQTNRIRPNPPNILNRTLQPMKHARPSSAAARDGGWLDAGSIQVVRCDGQLGSVPNLSKSPVCGEIAPTPRAPLPSSLCKRRNSLPSPSCPASLPPHAPIAHRLSPTLHRVPMSVPAPHDAMRLLFCFYVVRRAAATSSSAPAPPSIQTSSPHGVLLHYPHIEPSLLPPMVLHQAAKASSSPLPHRFGQGLVARGEGVDCAHWVASVTNGSLHLPVALPRLPMLGGSR